MTIPSRAFRKTQRIPDFTSTEKIRKGTHLPEKTALDAGAEIVGINNRDLHTFQTDLAVTEALAPRVPRGRVVVSESGIASAEDMRRLRPFGVHAVLVGEALVTVPDVGSAVRRLLGRDLVGVPESSRVPETR